MSRTAARSPLLNRFPLSLFTAGDKAIAVMALLIVAYYAATPGIFQGKASGDGYFGFLYLPGLFHFHTLDLGPVTPFWSRVLGTESTGHVANACPIGPVAFWIPPYLLGLGLQELAGLVVALPRQPPGESPFLFWMAGLGSLLAGLAGVAVLFRLLVRKLGLAAARFGVATTVLATPLIWYLVTQPLYQHATAFLMVTLLVERWDHWRGDGTTPLSTRQWLWLGALLGGAMLMRFQEGMWALLPGLDAAARAWRALRQRRWRGLGGEVAGLALMALVAGLVFAPQLATWQYYFGHLRPPQPPGHMRWFDPGLVATLFSTRGGLLPWAPILYLVVPGLVLSRRRLGPGIALRLGLLLAIEIWVNASAWDHWGSWTFGPRRFTDATVIFAASLGGLHAWLEAAARRRASRALLVVAALAVAVNFLIMESVRAVNRMKSSGATAAPASQWIKWAGWPAWPGRLFDATGYPFCQPAGWIWSAIYDVPPRVFEGVVGNYFLERDCRIHPVIHTPQLTFAEPGQFVPDGLAGPAVTVGKERLVPVARRVRVLVPLFAAEPIRLRLRGDFQRREAEVRATWNGVPLAPLPQPGVIGFEVAAAQVHTRSRVNVLWLDLPDGVRLGKLEFESLGNWWQ